MMAKRFFLFAVGTVVMIALAIGPAVADVHTSMSTSQEVTTISTQAHPKKLDLAYLVTQKQRVLEAALEYRLDRWNWGPVALPTGGRMIGTLKVIGEGGTRSVGKRNALCESHIWQDERGSFNQRTCGLYWEHALDLEPGDVVRWTVKFKKMPKLEFENFEDTVYRDRFTLEAFLHTPWPETE